MDFLIEGKTVRQFAIHLADGQPQCWMFSDMEKFKGQSLTIQVQDGDEGENEDELPADALDSITQSDGPVGFENLYHEKYRPQFHFSSRRGWMNDPNGPFYYKGKYHLFYQHNPYSTKIWNQHWGHAVSSDLVHWQELPAALEPDEMGFIFSGSAVVDWHNTAGFQQGDEKAIVCLYTSAGDRLPWCKDKPFTQSLAYSTDAGMTWTKYEKNPVLLHVVENNRDPKVFWYAPQEKWVMILFLTGIAIGEQQKYWEYGLFHSKNLKEWQLLSKVVFDKPAGAWPDMFELAVDGDPGNKRWVVWPSGGPYMIGRFDGRTFVPETEPMQSSFGNAADQVWNDLPAEDGRTIQISWLRRWNNLTGLRGHPGMPFDQQMTVPRELKLQTTDDGLRVFCTPIREIEKLRVKEHAWENLNLAEANATLANVQGDLFDISARLQIDAADEIAFHIYGFAIVYDVKKKQLKCGESATLEPVAGQIDLRILVDRTSLEVFANQGRLALAVGIVPEDSDRSIALTGKGGAAQVVALTVHEMRSIWP